MPIFGGVARAENLTLTGSVAGKRDANEFWLRSYDRYYRIAGTAPFTIKNGDRIRVSGAWKGGVLTGSSWKAVAPLPARVTPNRSISGAVYRDLPGDEFQVKDLGGAIYRVLALKGEAKGLNRGDIVRVVGRVRGGVMLGTNVIITAQRNPVDAAPSYQPHRAVVGTVGQVLNPKTFEIISNGRRDRVLTLFDQSPPVKAGARVRIWAFWDNEQGLWQASNLRVLSGSAKSIGIPPGVAKPYGPNFGPPVVYGTFVALKNGIWTVKSGQTNYPVRLLVARPGLVTVGSKVKLTGTWRSGTMRVSKIEKWNG